MPAYAPVASYTLEKQRTARRVFDAIATRPTAAGPSPSSSSLTAPCVRFGDVPAVLAAAFAMAVDHDEALGTLCCGHRCGASAGAEVADVGAEMGGWVFDWAGIVAVHDALVVVQAATLQSCATLFALLDAAGTGTVAAADLRYAVTRLGPSPVTAEDFDQLMTTRWLAHKQRLSRYEVLCILLGISPLDLGAAA